MRKFEGDKIGFRKAYVLKYEPFIWDTLEGIDSKEHKRRKQSRKDKIKHRNKKNNKYKHLLKTNDDSWVDDLMLQLKTQDGKEEGTL